MMRDGSRRHHTKMLRAEFDGVVPTLAREANMCLSRNLWQRLRWEAEKHRTSPAILHRKREDGQNR